MEFGSLILCSFSTLFLWLLLTSFFTLNLVFGIFLPSEGDYRHLYPSVCIGIHVFEGRAYALPYTLGYLENWRYPKDRMRIQFFTNDEESDEKIWSWTQGINRPAQLYRSIESQSLLKTSGENGGKTNWQEDGLRFGRKFKCDYLLLMTSDDFILEKTLKQLIDQGEVVVSPLLNSPLSSGHYSNVEGLLGLDFAFRERTESIRVYYPPGPTLIWLKHSDSSYLSFDEDNMKDEGMGKNPHPTLVFGASAFAMNISIRVANLHFYGWTFSTARWKTTKEHQQIMSAFLANAISDKGLGAFPQSSVLAPSYPPATKHGFDKIFLINLRRRPERLQKMREVMRLVGLDYEVFEAVDGANLTAQDLAEVKFLPGYEDPYHRRPMTRGELGCFFSHHRIWERVMADDRIERVLVFEDDVRFSENGTLVLDGLMEDLMGARLDWDFIYLGRKKMSPPGDEFYVQGHRFLSTIGYSYWTLGYALSRTGAHKLVSAKPKEKLLALDEFLPIMYARHPNKEWSDAFAEHSKLDAFAVYPVVVEPERYTNQPGYVSDTEQSAVLNDAEIVTNLKEFTDAETVVKNLPSVLSQEMGINGKDEL